MPTTVELLATLNESELRIRREMINTSNDIWYDVWGEETPSKDEYADVIIDRVYDRISHFDQNVLRCMSDDRKRAIALSTL